LKLDLRQTEKVGFEACFPLRRGRAHEAVGPSAVAFAAAVCGTDGGNVLWIAQSHLREQINPAGLAQYCDPANVLFACAKGPADVLAVAEEALRSGAVSVVVAQINKPLDLTAGRRLQLAAEAGRAIGLFVILEDMGSNATETRWRCDPLFDAEDSTLQRWHIIKNKKGTLTSWVVRWNAQTRCIIVVSTPAV
jgi:protein ImuA